MFDFNFKNYGYLELIVCIILNIIGLVFIQSSLDGTTTNSFISQIMISIFSIIMCFMISLLNLKRFMDRPMYFMIISVALLLLVKIVGTAYGRNSIRWIQIPIVNTQIQPSEFAKIFLILFMSKYIEKMGVMINRFGNLVKVVLWFSIPFLLILTQPNLSSALILLFIFIGMLFVSELKVRWFVIGAVGVVVLYVTIYLMATNGMIERLPILQGYQKQRIMSFFSQNSGDEAMYQQENSVIAIGSGQVLGKGINNDSPQSVKNGNWLSEAQNDFIFAVVGEEVGFVGSLIIILLYVFLIIDCLVIAMHQREVYKKIIGVGIATWIGCQSFINLGVATSIIPNTGIPLPFFSQGGSSLMAIYIGMGFLLNIKRDAR